MGYPDTSDAFVVTDLKKWSDFKRHDVKLKPFEDRDIDVAVEACGVCASDVHTISGGWGSDVPLPLCVGHEIVGRAVRVGPKVTTVRVGDRVGVGAQINADLTCATCAAGQENYCPNKIDTYGAPYPDGTVSQGGYSSHVRAHEYFTFRIPDALDSAEAAPMLCAGLTTFSPIKRLGGGPGKKIGIVGLGGLGHFALQWSVALGAEAYVISHSPSKKDDALQLGAKAFVCSGDKDWAAPWHFAFDFIICTANATQGFNLETYLSTLKVGGAFHMVGFPDDPLPSIHPMVFSTNGSYLGSSHIGNRPEMIEMLGLAAQKGIKGWVHKLDISEASCKEAVERVDKNDNVRYRFTLVGFDKVFGKRA